MKILLAEDDNIARFQMGEIIQPVCESIMSTDNGETAWEHYKKESFDLVITDICMPKVNGITLIRDILDSNPKQRMIAISAYSDSDILIELINLGILHFVLKPIDPEMILNKIRSIREELDKGRQLQEYQELIHQRNAELEAKTLKMEKMLRIASTKLRQNSLLLNSPSLVIKSEKTITQSTADRISEYMLEDHMEDLKELELEIDANANLCVMNRLQDQAKIMVVAKDVQKYGEILSNYPKTYAISQQMLELSEKLQSCDLEHLGNTQLLLDYLESFAFTLMKWREALSDPANENPHVLDNSIICDIRTVTTALSNEEIENSIEFF